MHPAIVGPLFDVATVTRPSIAYAVAAFARYLSQPSKELLDSGTHVVKYLKYTEQFKLVFGAHMIARHLGLHGVPTAPRIPALTHGDADCATCVESQRPMNSIVITVDGTPVVSASRLHSPSQLQQRNMLPQA
jgi:hypothetical protein